MAITESNKIWGKVFTEKTGFFLIVAGLVIFVCAIVGYILFSRWSFSCTLDEEIVGQFGDFVGGAVGTLFALAGVVLYYVALTEQRKDLKINQDNLKIQTDALTQQIEEFKAQKEEMAETRKVYEQQTALIQEQTTLYREQSDSMKKQAEEAKKQTVIYLVEQFDASFYPILNLICSAQRENSEIIDNIYSKIQSRLNKSDDIKITYDKILEEYENQYQIVGEPLGRLFDMITQLVGLIHKSTMLDDDKERHYISILHSQLSGRTNVVLFYHLFSDVGKNKRPVYQKTVFFEGIYFMKRCEFANLYPANVYISLSKFAGDLSLFISRSLEKVMSIEGLNCNTDEKINMMGVEAQSQMRQNENNLHYCLNVKKIEWEKTRLDIADFSQFLSFLLHDVRYIRSFNMPVADNLISKIDDNDEMITFGFEIIIE